MITPALVAAVDAALPESEPVLLSVGEADLPETHLNGDLLIAAHAGDPSILEAVRAALLNEMPQMEEQQRMDEVDDLLGHTYHHPGQRQLRIPARLQRGYPLGSTLY